jgi:hypothetical protein
VLSWLFWDIRHDTAPPVPVVGGTPAGHAVPHTHRRKPDAADAAGSLRPASDHWTAAARRRKAASRNRRTPPGYERRGGPGPFRRTLLVAEIAVPEVVSARSGSPRKPRADRTRKAVRPVLAVSRGTSRSRKTDAAARKRRPPVMGWRYLNQSLEEVGRGGINVSNTKYLSSQARRARSSRQTTRAV